MKVKKKSHGTRQKIRKQKKRQHTALVSGVVILVAIISMSGLLINSMQTHSLTDGTDILSKPRAAIVDHLSLTIPNRTFVDATINTLKEAGYSVDYYPGENVTVGFFADLPTHGYKLIVFRVHSSSSNPDMTEGPVTFFTSERYDRTKYVYEQLADQIALVAFSREEMGSGITYFGINPSFITGSIKGRFQNTVVIVMGCESLSNPSMAQAFIAKGAKAYLGWNTAVSAPHTDVATTHLLRHFLIEKRTIKESVEETFREVGPDPLYQSLLDYYPIEVGEWTTENACMHRSLLG